MLDESVKDEGGGGGVGFLFMHYKALFQGIDCHAFPLHSADELQTG